MLGRWAGLLVYASLLIYLLGALTAYVTFGGIAVESLTGLPFWAGTLAYWLAGSYIVWRGAKSVGTSELVMVFAFLSLLAAVVAVLIALPLFKTENLHELAPAWFLNRGKDPETGREMHLIGSELVLAARRDVDLMKKLKSWKGVRHSLGLKVRGQRTVTTGRFGATAGVTKKKATGGK